MAKFAELKFKAKRALGMIGNLEKGIDGVADKNKQYLDLLASIAFRDIIRHFQSEEGPEEAWEPWSEIYEAHMIKIGKGGNKILQDTGNLRQQNQPANRRKVQDGVLFFNPAKTKGGFPYAFAHDNNEQPRKKLPRRPFMWLSENALEDMAQNTLKFINKL